MKKKYNTTLVFNIDAADMLLMQGYKIVHVRYNFKNKDKVVFVFEGDVSEPLDEILEQLGQRKYEN